MMDPVASIVQAASRRCRSPLRGSGAIPPADANPPNLGPALASSRGSGAAASAVEYRPRRLTVRLYLRAWRVLARLTGMVQGATQFCHKRAFEQVGGYDENAWIGEDVDFHRALRRLARAEHGTVRFIRQPRVQPSCRRFDRWPLWRVLIWTNPLFIAVFRRWKAVWTGWYSRPVR